MIPPELYRDAAAHALEQRTLFANHWVFVGLLLELKGLKHLGVRVGDVELLVQRDRADRPRAYRNVCSHRHAQLCTPGLHSGAVRCPYHGWVYDRDGVPVGIPQPQAFPLVVADPAAYRLTEFACEVVGEFIFVRLSAEGPSLAEYLGPQQSFLQLASEGMNEMLDEFSGEVAANWKVVIENSLEGYHVPAVHSQTFMQIDGLATGVDAPRDDLSHPLHSSMEHPTQGPWLARFARTVEPKIGRWPSRFEHYTHRHIFPNLTVTSFMGYSFHVQSFEPTDVERTTVRSRTVGVKFEHPQPVGEKMMERIHAEGHKFTRQVFDEDGGICSIVQAGLRQATRLAVLAQGLEDRVAHFQAAYLAEMRRTQPNEGPWPANRGGSCE